jgi:hypothetical protein
MSAVLDASAVAALFRRRATHNAVLRIQKALAAEVGLDFSSGPGVPARSPEPPTRSGSRSSAFVPPMPTASPATHPSSVSAPSTGSGWFGSHRRKIGEPRNAHQKRLNPLTE